MYTAKKYVENYYFGIICTYAKLSYKHLKNKGLQIEWVLLYTDQLKKGSDYTVLGKDKDFDSVIFFI